jgi:putative membrane protein
MPRITFIRIWEETEPPWDRGNAPWIVRVAARWGITMAGFLVAELIIDDIIYDTDKWFVEDAWALMLVAAIYVLIRLIVRPILLFLTCPRQILALGLFICVINAIIVLITEWWAEIFDVGFRVDGFIPAFLGALFISAASFVIDRFLRLNPIGPNLRT